MQRRNNHSCCSNLVREKPAKVVGQLAQTSGDEFVVIRVPQCGSAGRRCVRRHNGPSTYWWADLDLAKSVTVHVKTKNSTLMATAAAPQRPR